MFKDLTSFRNLESISILASGIEIDYHLVESIANLQQLKYIHIAMIWKHCVWPDLAPLGKIRNLKTLEISSKYGFQQICGFDELNRLEKLVINTVNETHISQELLSNIQIFCPQFLVEINENWNESQW